MGKRNKKRRNQEKKDAPPQQSGNRLYLARESRGLSIEDVAARLKLDVGKISALEQGNIADFAAPVFAAGYLRAYARLLELSEAEVFADFDELVSTQAQVVDPVPAVNNETYGRMGSEKSSQFSLREKPSGNRLKMAGFVSAIVLGLIYFLWPANEGEHVDVSPGANVSPAGQTVEKTLSVPGVVTEEVTNDTPAADIQPPAAQQEQPAETESRAEVTPALSVEPVAVPDAEVKAPDTGLNSELVLIFHSDSWAEVQDARGQRLVYRLGKAGTRRVVTGVAPFMVQLGYVQGVDILYNGTAYDLSKYANRRSVRLRIGGE